MERPSDVFDWARNGHIELLATIPAAAVNIKNEKGYSPLMLAAYHGHSLACELLLAKGADANSVDLAGNSILMGVAFKGHLEIAQILIENGADISYRNSKNQNALHFAQLFGRSDVIKYLKEKHNQQPEFGLKDIFQGWSSMFRKEGN
jgi:hypothetical protein